MKLPSLACRFTPHEFGEWEEYIKIEHDRLITGRRSCACCGKLFKRQEDMKPLIAQAEAVVAQRALDALNASLVISESICQSVATQTQKITI